MLGDMKAQQEQLEKKLAAIEVTAKSEDGLIDLRVNGHKEVLDLTIHPEKWTDNDMDQLQDMLIITLNKAFDEVTAKSEEVTAQALNDLLPGGMGGLGNLFGGA